MSESANDGSDPLADFARVDVRVGTIVHAERFEGGRTSTHVLRIDFGGEVGARKSLARLPAYADAQLVGRQVLCLVGLAPRQIGGHMSEVLTLAVPDADGRTVLVAPDHAVPPGGRLH